MCIALDVYKLTTYSQFSFYTVYRNYDMMDNEKVFFPPKNWCMSNCFIFLLFNRVGKDWYPCWDLLLFGASF